MDWWKSFALLVVVASVYVTADAPKKKIRIHLPQKVKHIHHHKKIYITNHPASSQYAPAFMPSAEGAVAVPTNIAMPAMASVELYDESPTRMPGITSAASKLLPLYRARGYYGPVPTEWDVHNYDTANSGEPTDEAYIPTAFSEPSAPPEDTSNYPPKKIKVIKLNEPSHKTVARKNKTKRVAVRHKPDPQIEEEHPVTTFHEKFYSDLDGSGTIKKVKIPQRIEKIIDGDTEHIHTYSEEHVHKLVFNEGPKLPRVVGIDAVGSMSALAPSHPLIPFKTPQGLIAIPPDTLTRFTAIGSMGTPSQLEYNAYNPREGTHDHTFHDHGEIPAGVDLSKVHLPFPSRVPYTSQGLRLGSGTKVSKSKYAQKYKNHQKPSQLQDFSYYEQVYAPYNKVRNIQKLPISVPFEFSNDEDVDDYRPVAPSFNIKKKKSTRSRNLIPALYFSQRKQVGDYRQKQASAPSPFSVSSTVVHEYKPKEYLGNSARLSKTNKDIYRYPNHNYDYDAYASSISESYQQNVPTKKGKKKSLSTQNIRFGGLDHQSSVNHLNELGLPATSLKGVTHSGFDNNYDQVNSQQIVPTAFMIRESSPAHSYYSAMALKAIHDGDQLSVAEASNDNYQYADAPTTPDEPALPTTATQPSEYNDVPGSEVDTTETSSRNIIHDESSDALNMYKETKSKYKAVLQPKAHPSMSHDIGQQFYNTAIGTLKYGDKI